MPPARTLFFLCFAACFFRLPHAVLRSGLATLQGMPCRAATDACEAVAPMLLMLVPWDATS